MDNIQSSILENYINCAKHLAEINSIEHINNQYYTAIKAKSDSMFGNFVLAFNQNLDKDKLEFLKNYYGDIKFGIWVVEGSDNEMQCINNGCSLSYKLIGMSNKIIESQNTLSEVGYNHINVQVIENLDIWYEILSEEFEVELDLVRKMHKNQDNKTKFVIAYKDGVAVGTGLLFIDGKTAGIYRVSVKKAHRHQGIGRAIVDFCLQEAKNQNVSNVILHSELAAENLYKRAGFKSQFNLFRYEF